MNEKINALKEKTVSFLTSENTKAVAKMVAEYALIAVVTVAVSYGLRQAGNAISAKFEANKIEKMN